MIAALPMYCFDHNAAAHGRLWALIRDGLRDHGIAAPDALDRLTHHVEGWGRADLVLGQICNLPYRAVFRDRVTVIAACDHRMTGTAPGYYRSVLLVRADDPAADLAAAAAYRMAINDPLSQSGWGAPHAYATTMGLRLNPVLRTGSHVESLRAVADGRAGLAALDGVTFGHLSRCEPAVARVRVIGRTHASPAMTLITAGRRDPAPYRAAISAALSALDAADRADLGLHGIVALPEKAYDIPLPPVPAAFAV